MVQIGGNWIAMTCSCITGMVAVLTFGPPYSADDVADYKDEIFGKVVRKAIAYNTGYNIVGSAMLTASVCAFMSTADSAINAASSAVTLDWWEPFVECLSLNKQKKDTVLLWIGKFVSFVIAVFALLSS